MMKVTYALETRLRRGPVVVVTVLGIFGDNYDWASFYALQLRQIRPAAPESLILSALVCFADCSAECIALRHEPCALLAGCMPVGKPPEPATLTVHT